jgi:hypothetical protein
MELCSSSSRGVSAERSRQSAPQRQNHSYHVTIRTISAMTIAAKHATRTYPTLSVHSRALELRDTEIWLMTRTSMM